jgi:DNA (cytosine-5)-methyltransferase 1
VAGRQRGQADVRYLWPEISRVVADVMPRFCVFENVPGILPIAGDEICSELERIGYSVGICCFEAAAVGAPHRRMRVFFVAHSGRRMRERGAVAGEVRRKPERRPPADAERPGGAFVAASDGERREERRGGREPESGVGGMAAGPADWLDGYWEREPDIPRTARGIPNRVSRLRALGNAVVWQQIFPIFKAIAEIEKEDSHKKTTKRHRAYPIFRAIAEEAGKG